MEVPFKYLGVPEGDNHRKKVFWNDMIAKIKSKLSSWKGNFLSFAGRVTLINVGDPTSTRDESLSFYISGCKPQPYEPILWG